MANVKLEAAKELIKEGKYAEARVLLLTIDDPFARQLIDKIDEVTKGQLRPGAASILDQIPAASPKKKRSSVPTLLGCLVLAIVACIVVGLVSPKTGPAPAAAVNPTANLPTQTRAKGTVLPSKTSSPTLGLSLSSTTSATSTNAPTDTNEPTLSPADRASQTRQAINDNRTATAAPKAATATFVAQYSTIARGELMSYADKHLAEAVKVQGRVFHIIDDSNLQLYLAGSNDAVYVQSNSPYSGIYENDTVTVYALIEGYATGTNAFGGEIKQPLLGNAIIVK